IQIILDIMENIEFEKLIDFNIKDKLSYISNTIVIKHVLSENEKNIMAFAIDYGKTYRPEPSSFSTFIKIIEGSAKIKVVDGIVLILQENDSIMVSNESVYTIEAIERFKMLSIVLKNGYNDVGFKNENN